MENVFLEARRITKRHAKTFYDASRFLPKEKRNAAYAVYAICRISDDAVDVPEASPASSRLDTITKQVELAFSLAAAKDTILAAFQDTVGTYRIPKLYFDEFLSGMRLDLHKNRYGDFNELYSYCYKAAGVIGLIMLKIFGYADAKVTQHAVDLGIAFQLTNIIRDVKEDLSRNRIYLPQDEMARFGVSEQHLIAGKVDNALVSLLRFQIERARQYYHSATAGIKMIKGLRSRLVITMMKEMYAAILDSVERAHYDVFSRRAYVDIMTKACIALKVILKGEYL